MILKTIIDTSANFTDEKFTDAVLLTFANKAIARINSDCNTLFPNYVSMTADYNAIPSNYQLDLISTYINYSIKMNDTSLSEADRYLEEFYRSLNNFKTKIGALVSKYANGDTVNGISPDYVDPDGFGGAYGIDTSSAIEYGWFGNNGNGGSY